MMGTGSDAADPRHNTGQLLDRPALAEFLKATKLRYLKVGIGNIAGIVKENLYLAMPFQSGYGINGYFFHEAP